MPETIAHKPHLRWKTLYHVTHFTNRIAIDEQGLLPSLSRGKLHRVWICELDRLPWAINHVCECHGWERSEAIVFRVCLPFDLCVRRTEGVYWFNDVIPPRWLGAITSC